MRRKTIVGLSVVGGLLLLLVVFTMSRVGGNPVTEGDNGFTVEIAGLAVPIASPEPLITGPDQYLGVPGREPSFDTSDLGSDLSLVQRPDELSPLDSDDVLRAVYVGHDTDGEPYYLWQSGSANFLQLIGQIIADFGSFGRIETSYGSEIVGDAGDDGLGISTGSIETSPGTPTTLTAEWHGLSPMVAAVVFYLGDDPVGWQRPVSGTAAVQYELEAGDDASGTDIVMVALDGQGEEWNRIVLFSG